MVKIKFSQAIPFPDKPGVWIRLLFKDNMIHQGHVLLFDGEEVMDLSSMQPTKPEVVLEGDQRAQADNFLATYTRLDGIDIKKTESQNGQLDQ